MCVLFIYLNDDDHECPYRLVVANNRDEYWGRPTATAEFRGDDQQWIGGVDLAPGMKCGTWLGLSKTGRLAALLDVYIDHKPNMKGRALGTHQKRCSTSDTSHLVRDFVEGSESCEDFMKSLSARVTEYNNFNFVCLELSKLPSSIYYFGSIGQKPRVLTPGCYSWGNNYSMETPFKKIQVGEQKFKRILQNKSLPKQNCVGQILEILNDKTQHYPDPLITEQFREIYDESYTDALKQRCAIGVWSPSIRYGTRTNTVILVDFDGNCDYYERALDTPVNSDKPTFSLLSYSFKIGCHHSSRL